MPRYKLTIKRTQVFYNSYEIEAKSAHAARDILEFMSEKGELTFDYSTPDSDILDEYILPDVKLIKEG